MRSMPMRAAVLLLGLLSLQERDAWAQVKLDPDFIRSRVKEHSLGVKAAELAKERTSLPEIAALSRYATLMNAEANYLYNEADAFSSPAEGRLSVASLNGGIARTLKSGTQLQLGLESSHSDFNARGSSGPGPVGSDRSAYSLGFVAGVSQPLLRNAWGESDWLRVEKARRLKDTTDLQIEETAEQLIQRGLDLYYRALMTQAEVQESQTVYGRLAELLRTTKQKLRFNLQMPGELPTLEAETRTWSRRVDQGQEALKNLTIQLRNLLRLEESDVLVFGQLDIPKSLKLEGPSQPARVAKIQESRLAIAQDDLEIARSEAKGDLTLNLQLKTSGLDSGLGDTAEEWASLSRPTFILGVKWQAPTSDLRFDAERYDKAVAVRQEEIEKQRIDEQFQAEITVARRNVETSFRLAQETEGIVRLWEKGAREQELGYSQGRVSLVELIRSLNALSQAKLEWLQYASQYHINLTAHDQLADRLYAR